MEMIFINNMFKKTLIIVILSCMLQTSWANSSGYVDLPEIILCSKYPGVYADTDEFNDKIILYLGYGKEFVIPNPKKRKYDPKIDWFIDTSNLQPAEIKQYEYELRYSYNKYNQWWPHDRDRVGGQISKEDAEKYEFKIYSQIFKMLEDLVEKQKKDHPGNYELVGQIKLPEEYVNDFFDYIYKKDINFFNKLQQTKEKKVKHINTINNIIDRITDETHSYALLKATIKSKADELNLKAQKQKNVVELLLIQIQKDLARLLLKNHKKITYATKVKYNNTNPIYNSLKNTIKFAVVVESKLHISMNEALEIAVALHDSDTFKNIKFPAKISRNVIELKLKSLAERKNYNENIENLIFCIAALKTKDPNSHTNIIIQSIDKNVDKAKVMQKEYLANFKLANSLDKIVELLEHSSSKIINEDDVTILDFMERHLKQAVARDNYEYDLFENPEAKTYFLNQYVNMRAEILFDYMKDHEIDEINDLNKAYVETKEVFVKQLKDFNFKDLSHSDWERRIQKVRDTRKLKKLDQSFLLFDPNDEDRFWDKHNDFKYKGIFGIIDKWFDQYYNTY